MAGNRSFRDYSGEKSRWITSLSTLYYPDYLADAVALYKGPLARFGELIGQADSSDHLFRLICDQPGTGRIQLCRIFRKYVCPGASVELLKRKSDVDEIIRDWGEHFRPLGEVRAKWAERGEDDEVIAALLWEYKDRGKKGYELTGAFFEWFEEAFSDEYEITGPRGAGRDIQMREIFSDYPQERPVDFIIRRKRDKKVIIVGLARYDSDRGGAQEDDRTGGYKAAIDEIIAYSDSKGLGLKVMLVNDGPGLALGSMWTDYAELERRRPGKVLVATMKMLEGRLTKVWLDS